MPRGVAASSDAAAEDAATQLIADGGNAIDAVMAGFLGAAASRAGVLLSPLVVMVAGVGVGPRCFDGRCVQPGANTPRPRGFVEGDTIPATARAAAPRSLATLSLLHAYGAARPMRAIARPALARAKNTPRLEVIEAFVSRGSNMLSKSHMSRALVRAAGTAVGGLLSEADLHAAPDEEGVSFYAQPIGELALPPLDDEGPRASEVLVVADGRGRVAVIAFSPDDGGVEVPELGLRLCRDAEPVRRGISRITPGTPRPTAAPIGLLRRPDAWYGAFGAKASRPADADALGDGQGLREALEALVKALGASGAWAASVQRQKPQITRA
jgi:hypothetical protein